MRLFTAIDVTDAARSELATEQKRLARLWPAARQPKFVGRDELHLTLVFIGHVADEAAAPFVDVMTGPLAQPPFEMELCGVGVFPPRGAPRVLWAGIEQGAREVARVQELVASRLERLGVAREARPYHPHVTLARWRDSRPSDAAPVRTIRSRLFARVPVSAVTMYLSRLSPSGPAYTALTRAELT